MRTLVIDMSDEQISFHDATPKRSSAVKASLLAGLSAGLMVGATIGVWSAPGLAPDRSALNGAPQFVMNASYQMCSGATSPENFIFASWNDRVLSPKLAPRPILEARNAASSKAIPRQIPSEAMPDSPLIRVQNEFQSPRRRRSPYSEEAAKPDRAAAPPTDESKIIVTLTKRALPDFEIENLHRLEFGGPDDAIAQKLAILDKVEFDILKNVNFDDLHSIDVDFDEDRWEAVETELDEAARRLRDELRRMREDESVAISDREAREIEQIIRDALREKSQALRDIGRERAHALREIARAQARAAKASEKMRREGLAEALEAIEEAREDLEDTLEDARADREDALRDMQQDLEDARREIEELRRERGGVVRIHAVRPVAPAGPVWAMVENDEAWALGDADMAADDADKAGRRGFNIRIGLGGLGFNFELERAQDRDAAGPERQIPQFIQFEKDA
ncbi:MAG: hypothetical protein Tsb0010_18640 [Parvularculaceae bacterium]